jgi:2-succinyl-6-hydroxy-2,4-cyclohexadiene-1-carboxylate synthase
VPKVVLVPGFTQTAASWRDVETIVDASCDVVAVDVPKRESFAATADAIGIAGKRGVYAGYSMGGRLCLRLALDHPEKVKALVLVSASPGLNDPDARRRRVEADEVLAHMVERDGVDAFLTHWLAQPLFATVPPAAPGLAERRALGADYIAHCLRVLGTGTMEPMWERLAELQMPVALVTGTEDTKFDRVARLMLERLRGEAVHIRLEGGHSLPLEQAAVLGGFIAAFAAEHG